MFNEGGNDFVEETIPGRHQRTHHLFNNSREGILFHLNGTITDVNPALLKISGFTTTELIGGSVFQWIAPQHHALVKEKIARGNDDEYEINIYHKSGHEIPVYLLPIQVVVNGHYERFVTIKEIQTLEQKSPPPVKSLTDIDPLTKLHSRHQLKRWLVDMSKLHHVKKHKFAVIHIAIERMKMVNDIFGRDVGDQLITQWANVLRHRLRSTSPHMLARVDGNHFAIALPYIKDTRSVIRMLENLQAELDAPYQIGKHQIDSVHSSYGVAFFPDNGTDAEVLMSRAEIASRQAIQLGNTRIHCFSKDMYIPSLNNLKLEARLKGALERDEMVLYYQPKVNATTEQVVGFEALIRWRDSEQHLVSPTEFIPIVEETGEIIPIGEWVIWSACEHLSLLQRRPGPTPKVSINLSSLQFQQPDLVEMVLQALTLFNVDPALLDLELTESAVMSDVEASITTLVRLKELGVTISIDDFGTGYSSLSYLKRFPIDTLKVDRSFITDITTNPQDESITKAIIALAKSLDLETVAEGVETREQFELLQEMGCDLIQGYLFGKPMPLEEALKLL